MKTKKQSNNDRIKRIVTHRYCPAIPVDAATLLNAEGARLAALRHPLARKMAWAFRLSAAKLETWCDPASLVLYRKV